MSFCRSASKTYRFFCRSTPTPYGFAVKLHLDPEAFSVSLHIRPEADFVDLHVNPNLKTRRVWNNILSGLFLEVLNWHWSAFVFRSDFMTGGFAVGSMTRALMLATP